MPAWIVLATVFGGSACEQLDLRRGGERVILARRVEKLRKLVQTARAGPLLGEHDAVLVVEEKMIERGLAAHLPWNGVVAERFRARITGVEVECQDGLALLRLQGSVGVAAAKADRPFAAVRLFGEVGVVEVDDATGTIRGRVALLAFEARPMGDIDSYPGGRRLMEELGRLQIRAFADLAQPFEMPVHLEQAISIAASGAQGPVLLHAGRIEVVLTVVDVLAYDGRLWVALKSDERRERMAAIGAAPTLE